MLKRMSCFIICVTLSLSPAAWAVSEQTVIDYAPIVKLHPQEEFFPSSVEFFLENVHQQGDFLVTNQILSFESDSHLPFFAGQNLDVTTPPVYAVRVPKPQLGPNVEDVHYFFFYPYNRGKDILGSIFGNHVGDWEKIRIRFVGEKPLTMKVAYHDSARIYPVPAPNTNDNSSEVMMWGTHPIIYSAKGSHGSYVRPGDHGYAVVLNDETAEGGKIWNTHENVVIIDYAPVGLYAPEINWMNFTGRWGNPAGKTEMFGYHILESGPLGPSEKSDVSPMSTEDNGG